MFSIGNAANFIVFFFCVCRVCRVLKYVFSCFPPGIQFHVSPNGQIVWCLRKPPATSSSAHEVEGGTVDVCLEPGGIRGLAKLWLKDQPGHWEFGVLRRVVFVDLGDNQAMFVTSLGHVKVFVLFLIIFLPINPKNFLLNAVFAFNGL